MQVARTKVAITSITSPDLATLAPKPEEPAEGGKAKEPGPEEHLAALVEGWVASSRAGSGKSVLLVLTSTDKGPDEKKPLPAFALGEALLAQLSSQSVDLNLGLALKNQFSVCRVGIDPAAQAEGLSKAGLKLPALVVASPEGKVVEVKALSGKMPDAAIYAWLQKACKDMGFDIGAKVKAHAELLSKIIGIDGRLKAAKTSAATAKGKNLEKFQEQVRKLQEEIAAMEAEEKTLWVAASPP